MISNILLLTVSLSCLVGGGGGIGVCLQIPPLPRESYTFMVLAENYILKWRFEYLRLNVFVTLYTYKCYRKWKKKLHLR